MQFGDGYYSLRTGWIHVTRKQDLEAELAWEKQPVTATGDKLRKRMNDCAKAHPKQFVALTRFIS
jgi:hypothetical protein